MREMEDQIGPNGEVLILAHSLGAHIISNYIYDLQKFAQRHASPRFGSRLQNMRTVAGLMTFGCNIPVFLFSYPSDATQFARRADPPGQPYQRCMGSIIAPLILG